MYISVHYTQLGYKTIQHTHTHTFTTADTSHNIKCTNTCNKCTQSIAMAMRYTYIVFVCVRHSNLNTNVEKCIMQTTTESLPTVTFSSRILGDFTYQGMPNICNELHFGRSLRILLGKLVYPYLTRLCKRIIRPYYYDNIIN